MGSARSCARMHRQINSKMIVWFHHLAPIPLEKIPALFARVKKCLFNDFPKSFKNTAKLPAVQRVRALPWNQQCRCSLAMAAAHSQAAARCRYQW